MTIVYTQMFAVFSFSSAKLWWRRRHAFSFRLYSLEGIRSLVNRNDIGRWDNHFRTQFTLFKWTNRSSKCEKSCWYLFTRANLSLLFEKLRMNFVASIIYCSWCLMTAKQTSRTSMALIRVREREGDQCKGKSRIGMYRFVFPRRATRRQLVLFSCDSSRFTTVSFFLYEHQSKVY